MNDTPRPASARRAVLTLLLVIALGPAASAEIRATDTMQAIERDIVPGTLVVFDIDNTLIEGVETLACDQWYDYYLKKLKDGGMSERAAVARANAVWLQVQNAAEVRPVEAATVALIARLQAKGVKVMALTARASDAIALTRRQLPAVGIDFSKSPVHRGRVAFMLLSKAEYTDGILYIDELNRKGEALARFLETIHYKPAKVVFVDDKRKHAENVDAEMGKRGIPCVAYQYTATYERGKTLDFGLAEVQLQYLGRIVPDSIAALIRQAGK